MKYLGSAPFAVTGEGTKKAQEKYRENYAKINWKEK
jgi:uncharacterized protein with HEPN domain